MDYGKDGNKYRNIDRYPTKQEYKIYHVYKNGKCVITMGYKCDVENELNALCIENKFTHKDIPTTIANLEKRGYLIETIVHDDFIVAQRAFNIKSATLQQQWHDDLYEYYGVDKDNPVIQKILGKAYEDGHSSGFQEVENHFSELLDFVQDILVYVNKGYKLNK